MKVIENAYILQAIEMITLAQATESPSRRDGFQLKLSNCMQQYANKWHPSLKIEYWSMSFHVLLNWLGQGTPLQSIGACEAIQHRRGAAQVV